MYAIDCADSSNRLNLHHLWLFFGYRGSDRGGDREKKRAKRERCAVERERVSSINFLGLKISIEYIK